MIYYLNKFERIVTGLLILLLAVVIVLALIDLAWVLV
jgi:hypothetical protein